MQELLFRHFEKGIFAALVLATGLLVYSGLSMPNYLDKQKPDAMEQGANQVKTSIDEDHWAQILENEDRLTKVDVVARTNESIRPVSAQTYTMLHPWEGKSIESSLKREDPKLLPPIDLMVSGVVANLAVKSRDGVYALNDLENAEPIVKTPERRRPERPRRGRGATAMMGSGSEMEGGMMGMEGEMGSGMMGEEMASGMMPGMPGGSGMPGMMGPGMGAAATGRRLDAKKFDQGFRPTLTANSNLVPVMGHFIAGVAVMPHKELYRAFDEALKNRDGYDPRRDQPFYLGFQLQRADVTDKSVDQLTEQDWVLRLNSTFYKQLLLGSWAGYAKEIVSGKYRDPELTTPIPPVLLEHYAHFASHPKIPLGDEDPRAAFQMQQPGKAIPVGPILPDASEDANETFGSAPPRGAFGGVGIPGMMESGDMEGGMMGAPGMMGGGSGMMMGAPGMMGSGSGMGMGMGMGMMGSGMGMMAGASIESQPDYKLIRFYDFRDLSNRDPAAPKVGRKYVYRIRVAIEDPNLPRNAVLRPSNGSLTTEVFRRVEQEKQKGKSGNSIRWTEFSQPSPVVSLPPVTEAYVGPVVAAATRKMQVGGREVEVTNKPATGKVVGTKWDPTYQVPMPIWMDVTRGSVLAKKGEADIPDPLSMNVKKLPDADLNLESVVVDLGGGQELDIAKDPEADKNAAPLLSPSWMLLFDADGGLRVVDEIESQKGYRLYSYADDRGE